MSNLIDSLPPALRDAVRAQFAAARVVAVLRAMLSGLYVVNGSIATRLCEAQTAALIAKFRKGERFGCEHLGTDGVNVLYARASRLGDLFCEQCIAGEIDRESREHNNLTENLPCDNCGAKSTGNRPCVTVHDFILINTVLCDDCGTADDREVFEAAGSEQTDGIVPCPIHGSH